MGKQSTRENKTIYQQYREEQGLTREKASQEMTGVSASRIEKIEYELQEPTPFDINPASRLQGTLSEVLPHYQSVSYASYLSSVSQVIFVYGSRHLHNIWPLRPYAQP